MENQDKKIRDDIVSQLNWDFRVNASKILVRVINGIVNLSGTVPTYPIHLIVYKNALLVPGIRGLNDQITVDFNNPSKNNDDDKLKLLINNVLLWLPNIDALKVKIAVKESWAILDGRVNSYWQKCQVEKIISTVPGISGVTNQLSVASPKKFSDEKIKKNIVAVLKEKIGTNINSVNIKVKNRVVYISGIVANLNLYREIMGVIVFAIGVVNIYEKISLAK